MTSEIASLVRGGTHQGRRKLMDYEDKIIIDKGFWLTGPMHCWRCSRVTSVTAMVVAQGLEAVGDEMVSIDEPMFVTSIWDLPEPLVKQLETVNPSAIFPNEGPEEGYIVGNRCGNCEAYIGELWLTEPGGPLQPNEAAALAKLSATPLAVTPFCLYEAATGYASGLGEVMAEVLKRT